MKEAEFGVTNTELNDDERGKIYLDSIYDSLLIFAHALNKTLNITLISDDNQTICGNNIIDNIWGLEFKGNSVF